MKTTENRSETGVPTQSPTSESDGAKARNTKGRRALRVLGWAIRLLEFWGWISDDDVEDIAELTERPEN